MEDLRRVSILVFTKDFEKWIEKFDSVMKIDYTRGVSWIHRDEVMLRNELFQVQLKRRASENCRGIAPSVIIVDTEIDYKIETEILKPLFGHGGSYIRGENYKLINEPDWDFGELENLIRGIEE